MGQVSRRRAQKAALNRRCRADALRLERRRCTATLRSEKEVLLRKLLWQEREQREELERELELCRSMVCQLRAACQSGVSRTPPVATSDPYMVS